MIGKYFLAPLLALAVLGGCQHHASSAPASLPVVAWDKAGEHYGETVVVCGPVAHAAGPAGVNAPPGLPPTLGSLVLGGEPTDDMSSLMRETWRFKVVIPDYHDGFQPNAGEYYRGKSVCVAGVVVQALVGGYEMILTHPSQVALQGEGGVSLPRGEVASLPAGAISYAAVMDHIGETKTVCGVVVAGEANVVPARRFPPGFRLPPEVSARLPADFELPNDPRTMDELYVGDRVRFIVSVLDDATRSLPTPALEYYLGKDVCVTGVIEPSIMAVGATLSVEDLDHIRVLTE